MKIKGRGAREEGRSRLDRMMMMGDRVWEGNRGRKCDGGEKRRGSM